MMTIVMDASVAVAFVAPDENSPVAVKALDYLADGIALVPSLFWHELRNALIVCERRKRIRPDQVASFLAQIRSLPMHDAGAGDDHEVLRLARAHGLTAYDAAYLGLALDQRAPLATTDAKLRLAAEREKAALFG